MHRFALYFVFALSILALPSRAFSAPITIDFETLSDFDPVTTQFTGVTFSDATVLTAGSSLNELEFPPHSGTNVVFDEVGPISISFVSPVSAVGGYFTHSLPLLFRAFGIGNNLLGSLSSPSSSNLLVSGDVGSSPNEFLQFAFGGISRVTVAGDPAGGSFVMDDFTYTTAANPTPVPEPATLGLLLIGGAVIVLVRPRSHQG